MTPAPQPQQHCDHERICFDDVEACAPCDNDECGFDTRSRPTPSPKTWESCREHFTCLNGEECWFLSEDYWRDQIQQAAAQAREDALDEIDSWAYYRYRNNQLEIRGLDEHDALRRKIESLRIEVHK